MIDYIRNGEEIYRKSFAMIRSEANLEGLPIDLANMAVRLIHACGMTDILEDLATSLDAVKIGRTALIKGAPILCDAQMVAHGIIRHRLPANNQVLCTLNDPEALEMVQRINNTRSATAVELWKPLIQCDLLACTKPLRSRYNKPSIPIHDGKTSV